jgi:uncharacterized repeat protein (TIGR02543 family)
MMKRANCLISTIRKATLGLAWGTAFLLTAILAASAQAQTDLDGSDLIVTGTGPWNISYHNSNKNTQSVVAIYNLANGTRYDYAGAFTGNLVIDITHNGYANNDNRFTFSNAGNSIDGGVAMHNGILFASNTNQLVSYTGGLTLDNAVFIAYGECDFGVTLLQSSFGGMRASGGNLVLNQKVTGAGDLVIVTDGNSVTLNGANDYAGVTSIGTLRGGASTTAHLILGADDTLPSTTVVEIGKSQNPTYNFIGATQATLDLNGTTQTISGLYGAVLATITNGTAAPANLTINLADGASYGYSGTIAGNSANNPINLTVSGAGDQALSGNIADAGLTKSGSGTLTLGGDSVRLTTLAVTEGTLAIAPKTVLTAGARILDVSCVVATNGNGGEMTFALAGPGDCDEVADVAVYADGTGAGDPVWATNGVALADGAAEFTVSPAGGVAPGRGQYVFATYYSNNRHGRTIVAEEVMAWHAPVAKIERTGAKYTSLKAALDAAATNDTITLLAEINRTTEDPAERQPLVEIRKPLTLDLNGQVITAGGSGRAIFISGVEVAITDSEPDQAHTASPVQYIDPVSNVTVTVNGGVITGCSDSAVRIENGGKLSMSGGTIAGNTGDFGAGVYAYEGSFSMSGSAKISGNTAESNGGGVQVFFGSFSMGDTASVSGNTAFCGGGVSGTWDFSMDMGGYASISGNKASVEGGGLYVDEGSVDMGGSASVSGNTAGKDGGGVWVFMCGLDMSGSASVSGNATTEKGGGIYVAGGSFNMVDAASVSGNISGNVGGGVFLFGLTNSCVMSGSAKISQNTATNDGGGVYQHGGEGSFTIKGSASVSGNTAGRNGGGIFFTDWSSFNLGGSAAVSGNNAGANGGGVHCDYGTFGISGSASVTGNTKGDAANNVYLPGRWPIAVSAALTSGASVGISMATPGIFTAGYSTNNTVAPDSWFSSDDTAYVVALDTSGEAMLGKRHGTLDVTQEGVTYGETLPDPVYERPVAGGAETVLYSGTNTLGTAYGPTVDKPTEAGGYTVDVTYETEDTIYTGGASFTIARKTLTVGVTDRIGTYDGTKQYGESEPVFSGLLNGHTASISYTPAEGTVVRTYANGTYGDDLRVVDGGAIDVTSNYELTEKTAGKLTIARRAVTFMGKSETKRYTGSEITISGLVVSNLVAGHTHNVTFSAKGTEVGGPYAGTITTAGAVRISAGGADVTANYAVTVVNGALTIEQDANLAFEVTLDDGTFAYDGAPHALPTNATATASSGVTLIEYSKDGGTWTNELSSLTATTVADSCAILVRATNPNYANPATNSAALTITKAANAWIAEPSMASWTVGATPATPNKGRAKFGTATVTYGVAGKAAGGLGTTRPSAAGSYVATFTVPETENYAGLVKNVAFTIAAAPPKTYKVKFNANGGKLAKGKKMAAQTFTYGKAKKLRKNKFKRKGYVFVGWAKRKNGPVAYKNAQKVKNLAKAGKTVTLYAVWAKETYKVVFDASGGRGKMPVQVFTYGKPQKLVGNRFTRKGYVFGGWAIRDPLATVPKVAYRNGQAVKNLSRNGGTVKLYAVWKKRR